MKKLFSLGLIIFAVLLAFSCAATPAPTPEPEQVETPPPPPPPPPPEPEPEPEKDTTGPELAVSFSTRFFSPDGDGVEDVLRVTISVKDESPISSWHIEIHEPQPPYLLFSEWSGQGDPPATVVWDGLSSKGELVQSASDYPFKLTVIDAFENSSVFEGLVEVDVLVIKEGNTLRVQVPSIVFGSNSGGFDGLAAEVIAGNDSILRRIAQVLNKFNTYQVRVEGHANPTTAPNTAARRAEEAGTARDIGLQPLSEARAKAVVDYLVNLGVARSRLTAFGIGGSRPVASLEDRDNWWKNRRVEFLLVK